MGHVTWRTRRALQATVLLETEETVAPACLLPGLRGSARNGLRRLHAEHIDVTHDALLTSWLFTLPRDAPAAFRTAAVALRWRLRVELVVEGARHGRWARPEELAWLLPLAVAAA